jgi:hypothetical protein
VVETVLVPEICNIFKQERVHGVVDVARGCLLRPEQNREVVTT